MKKIGKRIPAFIVALAMVINAFTGIGMYSVKADTGSAWVGVADSEWEAPKDETPGRHVFNDNESSYGGEIFMQVYEERTMCLAEIDDQGNVSPVSHSAVSDSESENKIVIENISSSENSDGLTVIDGRDGEIFDEGVFLFRTSKTGVYNVTYNDKSVVVSVEMPTIGIYAQNTDEAYGKSEELQSKFNGVLYPARDTKEYYVHLDYRDKAADVSVKKVEVADRYKEVVPDGGGQPHDEPDWTEVKNDVTYNGEFCTVDYVDERTLKVTVEGEKLDYMDFSLNVYYFISENSGNPDDSATPDIDESIAESSFDTYIRFSPDKSGLAIAGAFMEPDQNGYDVPKFEWATDCYGTKWFMDIFEQGYVSLGVISYDGNNNARLDSVKVDDLLGAKLYAPAPDDKWQEIDEIVVNPENNALKNITIYSYEDDNPENPLEDGLYKIVIQKEGRYKVVLSDGSYAFIDARKPCVAVYTTDEPISENLYCNRGNWANYDENVTYYLNAFEMGNMWRVRDYNATITVSGSENVTFIGHEMDSEFIWKATDEPSLAFTISGTEDANVGVHFAGNPDDEYDEGEDYDFYFYRKASGMVVAPAVNVDEYNTFNNDYTKYRKTSAFSLGREAWISVGVIDANDPTVVNPLPVEELMGLKLYKNGEPTGIKPRYTNYWENQLEPSPGIVWFDAQEGGTYELRKADGSDYAEIDIVYPWVAFTKAKQGAFDISDENVRGQLTEGITTAKVTGGEQNKLYISVRSDSKVEEGSGTDIVEISGISFSNDTNKNMVKDNVSCVIAEDKKSAVVTVKDKFYLETLDVNVSYRVVPATCVNGKIVPYEDGSFNWEDCLLVEFDQDVLTDGDGGKTFSAVFMPKAWYDNKTPWSDQMDYIPYWVHDDSMQGAIDKLVDAANQEYAAVYSSKQKKWIKHKVVNTGYIYIVTNVPRGGMDLGKSYISCPGDLKGIMICAGSYEIASFSDSKETTGLDFMDAEIMDPADFATKLNNYKANIPNKDSMIATLNSVADAADGVMFEAGVVYRAVKKTHFYVGSVTGRQHVDDYYYFDKTPLFSLEQEIFDRLDVAGIPQLTYLEGVNITASQSCGYVFRGDMGELRIGFPENFDIDDMAEISINNFEYDFWDTDNSYLNDDFGISFSNGAASYPNGIRITSPVTYFDQYGREYNYEIDYPLYTYEIKMDTEVEGNVENVEVNGDDLDPNAFKNLSQDDKKKVENGAKLTVKVRADAVNPENLPAVAENDGMADLKQSVAEIDDTLKDYDKDKINGDISYFDMGVSTSMPLYDRSAGAGEEPDIVTTTDVIETSKPMEIIIPVSGKQYIDLTKVRFVRSHKTADGSYTNDFFKMYTDEAKFNDNRRDGVAFIEAVSKTQFRIHILSSKFSTFAMFEYDGEQEEVDLSGVAWDYADSFYYDGEPHEVVLTGLPSSVMAIYKGNYKTDVGEYIATVELSVTDDTLYKLPSVIPESLQSLEWSIKEESQKPEQTISFEAATLEKTYGDAEFTYAVSGAKSDVTYTVTSGTDVAKVDDTGKVTILKAGTAVIEATAAETSSVKAGSAKYTLTVKKAAATITVDDKSKVFGEDDPEFTATVTGLVGSDTLKYSLSRVEGTVIGTYDITATCDENLNYVVNVVNGKLTISDNKVPEEYYDPSSSYTPGSNTGSGFNSGTNSGSDPESEYGTKVTTKTNADGSETKISVTKSKDGSETTETVTTAKDGTVTKNIVKKAKDGTVTITDITEKSNGSRNFKEVVKDKSGEVQKTSTEDITISSKGTKTVKTTVEKKDGYSSEGTTKTYKSGKSESISTVIEKDKTVKTTTETRTAKGTVTTKTMVTPPKGKSTIKSQVKYANGTKVVRIYTVKENGAVRLDSYSSSKKSVTIPTVLKFNGVTYPVDSIASGAFAGNTTIETVKIKDNITYIGEGAFEGAENLKNIKITGSMIKKVKPNAFSGISTDAVFKITASKKEFNKIVKKIKKSGVPDTVTFERIKPKKK